MLLNGGIAVAVSLAGWSPVPWAAASTVCGGALVGAFLVDLYGYIMYTRELRRWQRMEPVRHAIIRDLGGRGTFREVDARLAEWMACGLPPDRCADLVRAGIPASAAHHPDVLRMSDTDLAAMAALRPRVPMDPGGF